MKHLLVILVLFLSACNSFKNLNDAEQNKIVSELDYISKIDQKFVGIPPEDLVKNFGHEKAWQIFKAKRDSVGFDNQKRIKKLFSKYGYLGFKEVGRENSNNFWIPIQHADNDVEFQKKMLKALKKQVDLKNASRSNYAMLEDRIAINTNKKQRFGSQVTYNEDGQAIPKNGLVDSINIEKLRSDYDLDSFKDYYNRMTTNHYNMNKEFFLKKGIKEPKLYN